MKKVFLLHLLFISVFSWGQKLTPNDYINQYAPIAQREMQRSGVPSAIILAQGILESESGNSELSIKSNNHFGIKCKTDWQGEKVYHNDDARGECFRKYNNVALSYKDHSDFLKSNERYAELFTLDPSDYKGWAKGLKKAGYATNPFYAEKLISLIERYNLQDYDDLTKILPLSNNTNEDYGATNKNNSSTTLNEENIKKPDILVEKNKDKIYYINETKAILANEGTSLLAIAEKYNLNLDKLLEFNEWNYNRPDILENETIVFIQRKRKQSALEYHIVKENETLYSIAQIEGIRLESLLSLNALALNYNPKIGEKLKLK